MATLTAVQSVQVPSDKFWLDADLRVPADPAGLIVFAHGSGSSRHSRRNREVADALTAGGFATLLLDLLTAQEESIDQFTLEYRFDIARLGRRVVAAIDWASDADELKDLRVGCFGASTGAAAALVAAADRRTRVGAVVSRGGRPDLAASALPHVATPTLLIVGGADEPVIEMNEDAMQQMSATVRLVIVPGATHLFEEPGAMDEVSRLALDWFAATL
jgi:pimeloyl-ACP methyl ester carboxylesterase